MKKYVHLVMKTLNFFLNSSILFLLFVLCAPFRRLRAGVTQLVFNYFSFQLNYKAKNKLMPPITVRGFFENKFSVIEIHVYRPV